MTRVKNVDLNSRAVDIKEVGSIVYDKFDEALRFLVVRGPVSFCAYVGIPLDHPLANRSYDDLPIECHGGLTFAGTGNKLENWPNV